MVQVNTPTLILTLMVQVNTPTLILTLMVQVNTPTLILTLMVQVNTPTLMVQLKHPNSNSNIDGTGEHSNSNSNIVEIGCSVGEFGTGIGSVSLDQCEGDASDDHGNCANNGDVDESDTGCEEGNDVFFL